MEFSNTEMQESFACRLPASHNTESTMSDGRQTPNRKVEVMNLIAHENRDSNGNIFFARRQGGCCKPSAVTLLRRASGHPGYALRQAAFGLQSEDGEQAFPVNLLLGNSWGAEDRPAIGPRWSEARLATTLDDEGEDEDEDLEDDDELDEEDDEDLEDEDELDEDDEDEGEDYEDDDLEDEDDEEEK